MTKQSKVRPILGINGIDTILSIYLLGITIMNRIQISDFKNIIPILLIHVIIFSWSQHAFFDNEQNKTNPLFQKLNAYFQMHHDKPADVLNNDSIWLSGTRAHCLYSTPAIIMTVFVHRLTKNNHILHFQDIYQYVIT